jgi:two-component system, sensor histidine kinase ChiS
MKKFARLLFIPVCLALFTAATLFAQTQESGFKNFNPRFEKFPLPGDTPGNSIQCIIQDRTGFLWFGSQEGLHRYDGQSILTYRHDPLNPNSLAGDYVEWIFQDSKGILWLAHWENGGLTALDSERETFTRYYHDPEDPESLSSNFVSVVVEDKQGYIWVGGSKGLDRLDRKTGKFKRFRHDPADPRSLSYDQVRSLYVDRQGALWAGTGFTWDNEDPYGKSGGLNRYDPKTESFTRYLHTPADPNSLAHNQVRALFEDSRGNFWVGTGGDGLHLMNRETGVFTRFSYDPSNPEKLSRPYLSGMSPAFHSKISHVTSIFEDRQGRIWITAVEGGLNVYDPASGSVRHFEKGSNPGDLTNNFLWQTCQSRDGVVWIASASSGQTVFKVKNQDELFPFFDKQLSQPTAVSPVRGILKDRTGNIWIGYESPAQLKRVNRRTGSVEIIPFNEAVPAANRATRIYSLSFDRDGNIWMGTDKGQFRGDPRTGRFQPFKPKGVSDKISDSWVGPILNDRAGNIWLPGWGSGLFRYDPKTGEVTNFRHNPADPNTIGGNLVWGLYEDTLGNLWVGGGSMEVTHHKPLFLDRFDPNTNTFQGFVKGQRGVACAITSDGKGNLWFMDFGAGFQKLNPATGSVQRYHSGNSVLPNSTLLSMSKTQDGKLWFCTGDALIEFDPETEAMSVFNVAHGVRPASYSFGSSSTASDGELLFGRNEGFHAFYPDQIFRAQKSDPPDVRITGFKLLQERVIPGTGSILENPIWSTDELLLSHNQNVFSFALTCFDFHNPTANQLQFMLEDFDIGWRNDIRDGETPPYINVRPGEYIFRVRGANSLGAWNMEGISLRITILPPWWRTWWAYSLYALAIIGLLFWFRTMEVKKQKQKLLFEREKLRREREISDQLRRVDIIKDQFLANTSHELRTPLQGIIGLTEHLYDEADTMTPSELRENLAMAISSGKRLNSLVNDILDFSKLKNADIALNFRPVSLYAMADVVLKNMALLAAGKNMQLLNDIPVEMTVGADENRLQQILFNLVGNAVKFTETGHVRISAVPKNGLVEVAVEDTGIGIPADKQEEVFHEFIQGDAAATRQFSGTGLGLSISKKLVELHGGTIRLESEEGKGSTFYFTLPAATTLIAADNEFMAISRVSAQTLEQASESPTSREEALKPVIAGAADDSLIHILVVDDEPVNQQVLKNHLSSAHYRITPALNGEEALRLIDKGEKFDLVLLDIMMPRMSGFEVCRKIREKYLPSELPVIMVTAKNQVTDLVQGLSLGANDYLPKPFSKAEFLARVKTQLNLHRINEATGKFVPSEFLRSLGRENITEVLLGDHAEREVTVLFADIRDYTSLSETMTPEENFNFVNAYNGRLGPIIQAHGGFVNQYLGDGLMAIFPHNSADALQASIAMQQAIAEYNDLRVARGRIPIQVGMGMHTGSLVMGIIGDARRMDAATIADTVNTASRLETLSKYYGANILLSKDSLEKVAGSVVFHVRYLGEVQVKGKRKPVKVYECFDGDATDIFEKKSQTLDTFDSGMRHYLGREFAGAIVDFESVLKYNPNDAVARLFLNKAAYFVTHGVPEKWTGVEMMESK